MQHVRDEKQNAFATSTSTSTASTSSTAAVASSSRTPTASSASFQQQKVWHDVAKPKSGDLVCFRVERKKNNRDSPHRTKKLWSLTGYLNWDNCCYCTFNTPVPLPWQLHDIFTYKYTGRNNSLSVKIRLH